MAREDNFDLINLDGPLTVESILKTLQQRFMDGHCYVSLELSAVTVQSAMDTSRPVYHMVVVTTTGTIV